MDPYYSHYCIELPSAILGQNILLDKLVTGQKLTLLGKVYKHVHSISMASYKTAVTAIR